MPDEPYSLTDLARLADVTPRTVRYYVAQGLLPSPDSAGPATRYTEGHLARLRLIRRLQRDHLPLAEIRARIERMTDDDIRVALDASEGSQPEPPVGTAATLAYVRQLMTRAGVAPRFYDAPVEHEGAPLAREAFAMPSPSLGPADAAFEPSRPDTFKPLPEAVPDPPGLRKRLEISLPSRLAVSDRSTWERIAIAPDVEIHVRRPLDRPGNKRVERLLRIARELFEEDT